MNDSSRTATISVGHLMLALVALLTFEVHASTKEKLIVWHNTFENPYVRETLSNIARLASTPDTEYELVASEPMEAKLAFEALRNGEIDIFIGGIDTSREQQAKVIYVPIDRGLLGFRVCLVNQISPPSLNMMSDFARIKKDVSIGVGESWVDSRVYQKNGFNVVTSKNYLLLFDMLKDDRFACFSRSVNHIDAELKRRNETQLVVDQNVLFVYPNSHFIFLNANNNRLYERFSNGMKQAIEDYSFYDIFDQHFADILLKHGIYERKLVFLENDHMSSKAITAINRFGIASFILPPSKHASVAEDSKQH